MHEWHTAEHLAETPVLYSSFMLFTSLEVVSVCQCSCLNASPAPSPVSTSRFSMSVSRFLSCKYFHRYHFSRFPVYALIYDICFSLSDSLHSVWIPVCHLKKREVRAAFQPGVRGERCLELWALTGLRAHRHMCSPSLSCFFCLLVGFIIFLLMSIWKLIPM